MLLMSYRLLHTVDVVGPDGLACNFVVEFVVMMRGRIEILYYLSGLASKQMHQDSMAGFELN